MLKTGRASHLGLAVLLALASLAFSTPGVVHAQSSGSAPNPPASPAPPPVSLTALIGQARALYPRVEGDVVEAQGNRLTVSLGRRSGVRPGLPVDVVREGREITHPKTGRVLGRAEETLGRAVVTHVFEGYSIATLEGQGAQPGDRVRAGSDKVKLMLLSLPGTGVKANLVEAVTNELYEGLNQTGRFHVILGDQINVWLAERKMGAEEFLAGRGVAEVAARFKVDNILAIQYKQVERKPFMEVRLFATGQPEPALTTAFFVPPSIKPSQPGRFSASDRSQPQGAERKPKSLLARLLGGLFESDTYSAAEGSIPLREVARFPFTVVSMDVAVAPADKIPRVAVTDGERIYVYKLIDRQLQGEWTYYARSLGRVISVQLADLLGDGSLQVVANRHDPRIRMNSLIAGVKDGKPVALVDQLDDVLIAMDEKGTGVKQSVWSQRYDEQSFFTRGQADRVSLRDGKLVSAGRVRVPDDFRATGATLANIAGKDQRVLAYIDEQHRLRLSLGAEELWRSGSVVGGGGQKIEVVRQIERGGRSYFYQMEPTPLAVDLDGDGVQEIVIPQNQLEGVLAVIYRGPAGMRFQQVNSGFDGVIGALGAIPGEPGESPTLVAAVIRHKNFLKVSGETQIIMTIPQE